MTSLLFYFAVVFSVLALTLADDPTCGARKESPTWPCPQENKDSCVRKFFQRRAVCKPDRPESDTLYKKNLKYKLMYFNSTVEQTNVTIGGLSSGKILDFMADYETNVAVLTLTFVNISLEGSTEYVYYETAKQPKYVTTDITELYPFITITTTFFNATYPSVKNSISVANITTMPSKTIGPCFTETKDPVLKSLLQVFLKQIRVIIAEVFNVRSRILAIDFIQKNLCNYGVHP